jgi:hypothetical protein
MESQAFLPAMYAVSPVDLIPDNIDEDSDVQWLEYCRTHGSTLPLCGYFGHH